MQRQARFALETRGNPFSLLWRSPCFHVLYTILDGLQKHRSCAPAAAPTAPRRRCPGSRVRRTPRPRAWRPAPCQCSRPPPRARPRPGCAASAIPAAPAPAPAGLHGMTDLLVTMTEAPAVKTVPPAKAGCVQKHSVQACSARSEATEEVITCKIGGGAS